MTTDDPYVYPGTSIIKNVMNLRDESLIGLLYSVEEKITLERLATYTAKIESRDSSIRPKNGYNFEHLCSLHKMLFENIYPGIAGKVRTVKISKPEEILGNVSVGYSLPNDILAHAKPTMDAFVKTPYGDLADTAGAELFAKNFAALWKVHPFREGNTRALSLFAAQYCMSVNTPLAFGYFADKPEFREALVLAAEKNEYTDLGRMFKESRELQMTLDLESKASVKDDCVDKPEKKSRFKFWK